MELPTHISSPDPEIYTKSKNYITIDVETTNIRKGDPVEKSNDLLLTVYKRGEKGHCISLRGDEYRLGSDGLLDEIERADFIIAHNAKFELGWLRRAGLDLTKVLVFDTLIAEYVLAGNRKMPLSLEACLKRRNLGGKETVVSRMIKGGVCPSEIPFSWLKEYCKVDVEVAHTLFLHQLRELMEQDLLKVMYTRCIYTPVLADLEFQGMHLDCDLVEESYTKYLSERADVEHRLNKMTGGINMNSSKQVGEYLYDVLKFDELKDRRGNPKRTAKGGRLTSKETIYSLKPRNKHQREFLELRKDQARLDAYLSKSLHFFKGACEELDGIFYANFNQCVTMTHRLSSSGKRVKFEMFKTAKSVQFQNFNRMFKPLFNARNEGWLMGETDAASLEYRVAVYLGQDEAGMHDIRNGVDAHSFTAEIIFGDEFKDAQGGARKQLRTAAKAHTFKPLYGGQSGTANEQRYYQAFKDKHEGIAEAQKEWKLEALRGGTLLTQTGLKFYFPDTRMRSDGYITNSTNICNYPVQSLATADIMPIAVTHYWHRLKALKLKTFMVNTVHDSAISEVHPDEVEIYKEISELSFTDDVLAYMQRVYKIDFNVPLEAEVELFTNWSKDR